VQKRILVDRWMGGRERMGEDKRWEKSSDM
jgi:hypothetical protein